MGLDYGVTSMVKCQRVIVTLTEAMTRIIVQQVKPVQSNQRHKHHQARFWPPCLGMCKVFCSSITLRKEEPSIANII